MESIEIEEGRNLNINFEKREGLIPAIVQDATNGQILMLAYVNREAYEETIKSSMATFWSTSRNELWKKGATSGDFLKIVDIYLDCDQDAIIYSVEPQGEGACHTRDQSTGKARKSCFYRKLNMKDGKLDII